LGLLAFFDEIQQKKVVRKDPQSAYDEAPEGATADLAADATERQRRDELATSIACILAALE
jgi:hypothetical protein